MSATIDVGSWKELGRDRMEAGEFSGEMAQESALADFFAGLQARADEVADMYITERRQEVIGFLRENSVLIDPLRRAIVPLREEFGATPLALEVFHDPESGDRQLTVRIRTRLPSQEALGALERFDEKFTEKLHPNIMALLVFLLR